jgi:hypothetical protein
MVVLTLFPHVEGCHLNARNIKTVFPYTSSVCVTSTDDTLISSCGTGSSNLWISAKRLDELQHCKKYWLGLCMIQLCTVTTVNNNSNNNHNALLRNTVTLRLRNLLNYRTDLFQADIFSNSVIQHQCQSHLFLLIPS